MQSSDLSLKTIDETKISNTDWDVGIVRTQRFGKAITIRIDATAKTTKSDWITIASGLPIPNDNYYYQGYDRESTGSYKIFISTSGILKISNRAAKQGTYIDTAVSYIEK